MSLPSPIYLPLSAPVKPTFQFTAQLYPTPFILGTRRGLYPLLPAHPLGSP